MEENNNNQPVSPVEAAPIEAPVTPETPVTPVEAPVEVAAPVEAPVEVAAPVEAPVEVAAPAETPVEVAAPAETPVVSETESVEAHPVPSLVIEDTSAPTEAEAPVEAPAEVAAPVAPAVEEVPAAPVEAPVTPEAPVAPAEVAAPVEAPVAPETPVAPATPEAQAPATPEAPAPAEAPVPEAKPKKKIGNIIAIVIIILCIVATVFIFMNRNGKDKKPENKPSTPSSEKTSTTDGNSIDIKQATFNGVTFSFPTTKAEFESAGWTLDPNFAQVDVAPGSTAPAGRVGNEPGGATIMVANTGSETKHVEDCAIYSATFYNPKDGSENVTFIGGIAYTSSSEDVKNKMVELGYKKYSESSNGNATNLKYFMNDNESYSNDYVEFYFVDNAIETVTINASY